MLRVALALMALVMMIAWPLSVGNDGQPSPRTPAGAFSRGPVVEPLRLSDACAFDMRDVTGAAFDVDSFQNALDKIETKGEVTSEDVQYAMGVPEKLLAIIEYQSRQDAYQGFGFPELVKKMNQKDLKRLNELMVKLVEGGGIMSHLFGQTENLSIITPETKLTWVEQEDLLAQIYQLIHKPRGLFRRAWETKSFREAYRQIRLEKIKQRIELSLFYQGMPATFEAITSDPKLTEKFRALMKANSTWISPLVFLGLWVPFAVYFPDAMSSYASPNLVRLSEVLRWLPPYVPHFSKFFDVIVTDEDRALALEKGPDYVAQRINERMGKRIYRGQRLATLSAAYLTVFSILSFYSIGANAHAEIKGNAQEIQQQWNNASNLVSDMANFGNLTPEQQADNQVAQAVALSNANGDHADVNSPAMKALRDQFLQSFEKQKKDAEKKKPNP